jgi:cytochrome c-type biogenesis protein CcmH/NrfG
MPSPLASRTLNREIVGVAAQQIEKDRDDNPEAHDLVIRGWDLFYRPASVASREEAQRAFERALEIDPRSVGAKIGLATILAGNLTFGWSGSTENDEAKAEQLLVEVIEGGGRLSMAHYAMGILRRFQTRMEESKIELETAIALDGNNAHAVLQLGHTLLYSGQPEAAIGFMERALCLNPRDPRAYGYYYILGASHLLLDNVDKAVEFLRKACAANPQLPHHHLFLAGALGLRGNLDEAKSALAEAIRLRPEVNSIARFRALVKSASNAQYWALREKTVNIGLRRAGFPEE